jgi:hypothetical protein
MDGIEGMEEKAPFLPSGGAFLSWDYGFNKFPELSAL